VAGRVSHGLPDITLPCLGAGPRVRLAGLRGVPTVVNIWGSWCAPCKAEQPALERLHRATRSRGVAFLGINIRDSRAAAQAYDENFGITYPSIYDDTGQAVLGFRDSLPSMAVPTTWVIAPDGTVAARMLGAVSESTLRGLIEDAGRGPGGTDG
jgi:thiol-disulfide isomerase/thioredoxin